LVEVWINNDGDLRSIPSAGEDTSAIGVAKSRLLIHFV